MAEKAAENVNEAVLARRAADGCVHAFMQRETEPDAPSNRLCCDVPGQKACLGRMCINYYNPDGAYTNPPNHTAMAEEKTPETTTARDKKVFDQEGRIKELTAQLAIITAELKKTQKELDNARIANIDAKSTIRANEAEIRALRYCIEMLGGWRR